MIFSWRLPAFSLHRFRQGFSQFFVIADKVIHSQPPKQMLNQFWGVLGQAQVRRASFGTPSEECP